MIASAIAVVSGLKALLALSGSTEKTVQKLVQWKERWHNDTAAATTTAIAEVAAGLVKQKCRLVGVKFHPSAAVTGTATNFFTLTLDKRTAAVPGTPVNLITYAADTPTTDDAVAFAGKDLYVPAYIAGGGAPGTDFDFAEGDAWTAEVAKAGSGQTFPTGGVELIFEARD